MKAISYHFQELPVQLMQERAQDFRRTLGSRRTVREFSPRPLPEGVLESCLRAAGSAPSGANRQPWHFCVVSDPALKKKIRQAAEIEESTFYGGRAPKEWLEALEPMGTDQHKPFLEEAPALVVIFAENHGVEAGEKKKNYYVTESVGIATGLLIAALHWSGLACLTHTPSPMGFLREILGRPQNERAYLILVVGYPADGVLVPDIDRKSLEEIASFH